MIKTTFPDREGFGLEVIAKEYIDQAEEKGLQESRFTAKDSSGWFHDYQ